MKDKVKIKQKKVEVECLYCQKKVLLPKLEGFKYTKWPVIHEEEGER